jgi:hypothetical protein
MIDKSIRQHYANGKLGWKEGFETIAGKFAPDNGGFSVPNIAQNMALNLGIKKLLGTGALSFLGPLAPLAAMFLRSKGQDLLSAYGKDGIMQAFTSGVGGFGSPQEGRELRQLEKRRDYMLHRRDVLGKNISEKNLKEVTNKINEIKKTAPVTVTDYEGEAYGTPDTIKDILDKQYEFEDKKTAPLRIPKTPDVIIPHLEGDRIMTTPTPTITQDPMAGDAEIAERIAAENRAAKADAARAAVAKAAAARMAQERGGDGDGGYRGDPGGGAAGSPFYKGGRVDKALTGRSRDI